MQGCACAYVHGGGGGWAVGFDLELLPLNEAVQS